MRVEAAGASGRWNHGDTQLDEGHQPDYTQMDVRISHECIHATLLHCVLRNDRLDS